MYVYIYKQEKNASFVQRIVLWFWLGIMQCGTEMAMVIVFVIIIVVVVVVDDVIIIISTVLPATSSF